MKAQISKVPIAIEVWKRGRATNEDLTFRAAGVMASVGLSHVKTSGRAGGRAEEKEIMKPISFWLTVTDGRTRTEEERDRLGIKSGKTTLAIGATRSARWRF